VQSAGVQDDGGPVRGVRRVSVGVAERSDEMLAVQGEPVRGGVQAAGGGTFGNVRIVAARSREGSHAAD